MEEWRFKTGRGWVRSNRASGRDEDANLVQPEGRHDMGISFSKQWLISRPKVLRDLKSTFFKINVLLIKKKKISAFHLISDATDYGMYPNFRINKIQYFKNCSFLWCHPNFSLKTAEMVTSLNMKYDNTASFKGNLLNIIHLAIGKNKSDSILDTFLLLYPLYSTAFATS